MSDFSGHRITFMINCSKLLECSVNYLAQLALNVKPDPATIAHVVVIGFVVVFPLRLFVL